MLAGVWLEKARIKMAIMPLVKMASLSDEKNTFPSFSSA